MSSRKNCLPHGPWEDLPTPMSPSPTPAAAKSPSAQLLEQVAQLESLSDTIEKLKVSPDLSTSQHPRLRWRGQGGEGRSLGTHCPWIWGQVLHKSGVGEKCPIFSALSA